MDYRSVIRSQIELKISQSIHGYKNGHQLLACSEKLSSEVQMGLREMSDSPGSGFSESTSSVLTGYPIKALGKYALARTWPAPEMSRPGCVWTHTLLISFEDLSRITDLWMLNALFEKPSGSDFESYTRQLVLRPEDSSPERPDFNTEAISKLIYFLYSSTGLVTLQRLEIGDQSIYGVWSQQWPKLRRSFRFRTWGRESNARSNIEFDLLLLDSSRSDKGNHLDILNKPEWVRLAVRDILSSQVSSLRGFFWKYGADTQETRAAYIPLVTLWKEVHSEVDDAEGLSSMLLQWSSRPRSIVRSVANSVSDGTYSNLGLGTAELLAHDIGHLRKGDLSRSGEVLLGRTLGEHDIGLLNHVMETSAEHREGVLMGAVQTMPVKAVIENLDRSPSLIEFVVNSRPDLLGSPYIWQQDPIARKIIQTVPNQKAGLVVNGMMDAGLDNYAGEIISKFGQPAIKCVLKRIDDDQVSPKWIQEAAKDPVELLKAMNSMPHISIFGLARVAQHVSPYQDNPSADRDVWMRLLLDRQPYELSDGLAVFLLQRGLAAIPPESDNLIRFSFPKVIDLIERHRIDWKEWDKIDNHLDYPHHWLPQSRTEKLCDGIASHVIQYRYTDNEINSLTNNNSARDILWRKVSEHRDSHRY